MRHNTSSQLTGFDDPTVATRFLPQLPRSMRDLQRKMAKQILITGAANGIGRYLATHFIKKGYFVTLADSDQSSLSALQSILEADASLFPHSNSASSKPSLASNALFHPCDVSSESSVQSLFDESTSKFSSLDALVNNAGVASLFIAGPGGDPSTPFDALPVSAFTKYISTNLTGAYMCARAAAPHLRKSKGCIINISSTRALMSEPNSEGYAASKAGLIGLTHAMAVSLGKDGVRVNAVSPGWIDVQELDTRETVKAQQEGREVHPPPELSEEAHKQHPVGRVGHAGDIARMVDFLVEDEKGFITGQLPLRTREDMRWGNIQNKVGFIRLFVILPMISGRGRNQNTKKGMCCRIFALQPPITFTYTDEDGDPIVIDTDFELETHIRSAMDRQESNVKLWIMNRPNDGAPQYQPKVSPVADSTMATVGTGDVEEDVVEDSREGSIGEDRGLGKEDEDLEEEVGGEEALGREGLASPHEHSGVYSSHTSPEPATGIQFSNGQSPSSTGSKTGRRCTTCASMKKACDKRRPTCGRCRKYRTEDGQMVRCVYPDEKRNLGERILNGDERGAEEMGRTNGSLSSTVVSRPGGGKQDGKAIVAEREDGKGGDVGVSNDHKVNGGVDYDAKQKEVDEEEEEPLERKRKIPAPSCNDTKPSPETTPTAPTPAASTPAAPTPAAPTPAAPTSTTPTPTESTLSRPTSASAQHRNKRGKFAKLPPPKSKPKSSSTAISTPSQPVPAPAPPEPQSAPLPPHPPHPLSHTPPPPPPTLITTSAPRRGMPRIRADDQGWTEAFRDDPVDLSDERRVWERTRSKRGSRGGSSEGLGGDEGEEEFVVWSGGEGGGLKIKKRREL
ncbi:hypothetical protein HDV00_008903 [Rhizophlyctis rosea]|nr:hypothetical protein HDV00_008903 [Rhizophlyctis rosea]